MSEQIGVVKYDVTDSAIAKMEAEYMQLAIANLEDKEGFQRVHEARMVVKNHRVAVEKKRKELNADALKWQRLVNSEAKRITEKLEPIETHLFTEENRIEAEKEKIRAEKERIERERVEGIRAKIEALRQFAVIKPTMTAAQITDLMDNVADIIIDEQIFMEFREEAEKVRSETWETLEKLEKERSEWEQEQASAKAEAERLEKQRQEQEAERKRLEAIQKEADEKARKEREALEAERRKIEAEKKALEDAKRAEKEKQERAEFERRAREEAKARAEAEAKEKVEREAREAAERAEMERIAKARQAAIAPDKEKLLAWTETFNDTNNPAPTLTTEEAEDILNDALGEIEIILQDVQEKARAL